MVRKKPWEKTEADHAKQRPYTYLVSIILMAIGIFGMILGTWRC